MRISIDLDPGAVTLNLETTKEEPAKDLIIRALEALIAPGEKNQPRRLTVNGKELSLDAPLQEQGVQEGDQLTLSLLPFP